MSATCTTSSNLMFTRRSLVIDERSVRSSAEQISARRAQVWHHAHLEAPMMCTTMPNIHRAVCEEDVLISIFSHLGMTSALLIKHCSRESKQPGMGNTCISHNAQAAAGLAIREFIHRSLQGLFQRNICDCRAFQAHHLKVQQPESQMRSMTVWWSTRVCCCLVLVHGWALRDRPHVRASNTAAHGTGKGRDAPGITFWNRVDPLGRLTMMLMRRVLPSPALTAASHPSDAS